MPISTTQGTLALDPAEVAAHYDDLDSYYRQVWGEHVHHGLFDAPGMSPEKATRRLIAVVAEEARVRAGTAVCDVGCGYGATARVLLGEYGAQVTALTISSAQHAYALAVSPGAESPLYLLRDWLHNDLEPGSFDAVIAIESSEHMPDLAAFFDQAARVLRPGGRLVVCAWLTRDRLRGWERRGLIGPICREGRLRGMETAAEYQRLGRASGLEPVAFRDLSRQVKSTWPICARRVLVALIREPANRRFLLRDGGPNRIFALTMLRIWLAYELGAMRYGILTYEKP
ncbi:MAG TPA: class I SAM-dependent methyltransferase [Isosphaeraceae bacterium]|jgi:tocopherol O-methyltransferase|nr:class I SAM-dependent methyltransferase [Isosphaeraceae bacterium]